MLYVGAGIRSKGNLTSSLHAVKRTRIGDNPMTVVVGVSSNLLVQVVQASGRALRLIDQMSRGQVGDVTA